MAWQLIYTSASRSLEAGRSGFGTVARHRTLSPLLVSAIERISQFSRLPGTDADRVIYCHRIVAVGGGRFHVLSAIRDAGADYTGRTNHIAHHLIIDPREVAQLGANGPSPAEVMLAMNWATSWNETPRFFEDSEEVKLSAIRSHSNGSAWGQIAGSPDQAWLLANGDASRGAYIIQPLRVDLRAIYAESLRLMPDRLWQTSFTTSLQPSDEPADFRWIGIEESSPLRTRIESSGRPVLNLAAPHLLPCVEISHSAPVLETRQRYPSASKPEPVITRTMPPGRDAASREPNTIPVREYAERIPITAFIPRRSSKWILFAAAGTAALILISFIVHRFVNPIRQRNQSVKAMAANLSVQNYFDANTSKRIAEEIYTTTTEPLRGQITLASKELIEALLNTDEGFAALTSEKTTKHLETLGAGKSVKYSHELNVLAKLVTQAKDFAITPKELNAKNSSSEVGVVLDKWHAQIADWGPERERPELAALVAKLCTNVDRQGAEALEAMLKRQGSPYEKVPLFKKFVGALKVKTKDPKTQSILENINNDLRKLESVLPPKAPTKNEQPPIVDGSKPLPAKDTEKRPVPAHIYFFVESNNRSSPVIEEVPSHSELDATNLKRMSESPPKTDAERPTPIDALIARFSFHSKTSAEGGLEPLTLLQDSTLRKNANSNEVICTLSIKDKQFCISDTMALPLFLIGKAVSAKSSDPNVFEIWFVSQSGKALIEKRTKGLSVEGDFIKLDPVALNLPLNIESGKPLTLEVAGKCAVQNHALPLRRPITAWSVDISDIKRALNDVLAVKQEELVGLEKKQKPNHQPPTQKFSDLAGKLGGNEKFDKNDRSKLSPPTDKLFTQFGGYVKLFFRIHNKLKDAELLARISQDLIDPENTKADEQYNVAQQHINQGLEGALKETSPPTAKPPATPPPDPNKEIHQNINLLKEMWEIAKDELPPVKRKRDAEAKALRIKIENCQTEIRDLIGKSLLRGTAPDGIYRISADVGGKSILIVEIELSGDKSK